MRIKISNSYKREAYGKQGVEYQWLMLMEPVPFLHQIHIVGKMLVSVIIIVKQYLNNVKFLTIKC